MHANPRSAFFDGIASQWDGWHDQAALTRQLAASIASLGVAPGESVIDVGCGTGSLTRALAQALGESGRIVAIDVSPGMLQVARLKVDDPRVSWHVASAESLPVGDGSADRVIFLNVWPHLEKPARAAAEAWRALRPGGWVHVWHLSGREQVNSVHAAGGEAIRHDLLAPASETATVLSGAGFRLTATIDDAVRYLVSAVKPPSR